jgi:hypothetical protein
VTVIVIVCAFVSCITHTAVLSFCRIIVDINPNGLSYASGAEDGYIRLHFFDKDYLDMVDPVPEDDGTDGKSGSGGAQRQ